MDTKYSFKMIDNDFHAIYFQITVKAVLNFYRTFYTMLLVKLFLLLLTKQTIDNFKSNSGLALNHDEYKHNNIQNHQPKFTSNSEPISCKLKFLQNNS